MTGIARRTTPPRRLGGVALLAVLVAAVSVLPVAVIALEAAGAGWSQAVAAVWRPRVGELLRNTLLLVAGSVSAALLLGVTAAWLVERTRLPGARVWRVLLVAPLAVPAFVNAYAWVSLRPGMQGLGGAVLVTTLSYFPFVFLPASAVLRGMDQGLEDSARALGHGPWRTFARVVTPQLRPAVLGGTLLVALHLLSEFGALAMMRFPTFTTAILEQYEVAFTSANGDLLAVVLLTVCLAFLTIEVLLRGHARYARVGRGSTHRAAPVALGRWTGPALAGLTALSVAALGVPVVALGRWLVAGWGTIDLAQVGRTVATTTGLGVVTAVVAVLAVGPAAWLLSRRPGILAQLVERATYLSSALPGVVVALALVVVSIRWARPLYQSVVLLVLAYAVLFLPRAMVTVRAAMAQAPPELVEAARALGQSPSAAFRRVVLPLIRPGLAAGFALVFIAVSTELTATLILAPTGIRTLAIDFWSASDSLDYVAAAPYGLAMVLLSAPLTLLLLRRSTEEAI